VFHQYPLTIKTESDFIVAEDTISAVKLAFRLVNSIA
jgi:hypothetical protein